MIEKSKYINAVNPTDNIRLEIKRLESEVVGEYQAHSKNNTSAAVAYIPNVSIENTAATITTNAGNRRANGNALKSSTQKPVGFAKQ